MKRKLPLIFAVLFVVIAASFSLSSCSCSKQSKSDETSSTEQTTETQPSEITYELSEDGLGYIYKKTNTLVLEDSKVDENIVIPATYKGLPIVEIDVGVFVGTNVKSIVVPGSVKVIKNGTFAFLDTLETITFQSGLQRVEGYAFSGCPKLSQINLPDTLLSIDSTAFNNTKIYNDFEQGAFYYPLLNKDNIESASVFVCFKGQTPDEIEIKEGTKIIADAALENKNFTSITLPESLISIGQSAFKNCENLKLLTIPSKVIEIGFNAFSGLSELSLIITENNENSVIESYAGSYHGYNREFFGVNFKEIIFANNSIMQSYKIHFAWNTYIEYMKVN